MNTNSWIVTAEQDVSAVDGSLAIDSALGMGTRVSGRLPEDV
jgi:signal transduction histidine kinase